MYRIDSEANRITPVAVTSQNARFSSEITVRNGSKTLPKPSAKSFRLSRKSSTVLKIPVDAEIHLFSTKTATWSLSKRSWMTSDRYVVWQALKYGGYSANLSSS